MRASATGAIDFTGVEIKPIEIVGGMRETMSDNPGFPAARGGSPRCTSAAWRGCSISCAGIYETPTAERIRTRRRVSAEAAMAVETARLWVERSPHPSRKPLWDREARSSLSPTSISRASRWRLPLSISMQLVQRSVGLQAFLRPNPIERIRETLKPIFASPARIEH